MLAAYVGDRGEFLSEWRTVVAEARTLGQADPVAYVRDTFASRNPLKNVFRSLTQNDYMRLLRSLDDTGRAEERSAVNRFNTYAESLDAHAFTGSTGGRAEQAEVRRRLLGRLRELFRFRFPNR